MSGKQRKTVADFIFGGSEITADGDCSHEIKRHSLLGRKAMTMMSCRSEGALCREVNNTFFPPLFSENIGLKLNIQETKIMASSPTTSWQIDGETVETVSDFIFLGSKITADGD